MCPFSQYFRQKGDGADDDGCWHYMNAVKVDEKIFHPQCYKDYESQGKVLLHEDSMEEESGAEETVKKEEKVKKEENGEEKVEETEADTAAAATAAVSNGDAVGKWLNYS